MAKFKTIKEIMSLCKDDIDSLKHVQLNPRKKYNDDCVNCINSLNCDDCDDCVDCKSCSNSNDCDNCIGCSSCSYCIDCNGCEECYNCIDCLSCHCCFGIIGGLNLEYVVLGKKLKPDEFYEFMDNLKYTRNELIIKDILE